MVVNPLRLQAFLRVTAGNGRTVARLPPFTAYLDARDPLRYLNYAIPDDNAEPDRIAVEELCATFSANRRLPRLEWLEEAAPAVTVSLARCGMVEELRAPLMACARDEANEPRAEIPDLVVAPVDDPNLRDCVNLQRAAFGQAALPEGENPPDPRARGGGAVLARTPTDAVAAASWTAIVDGATEIVGVATAEAWRGRGLAGVVTAAAARQAFAVGASVCILSPGNETAQRVYARAGFRCAATMLHWSVRSGEHARAV
jgi:GNAT superfamily N-acetyltransferase